MITAPETMPVAPETVTPLRPSEALRLGRLTRPLRITGKYLSGSDGACALGAMLTGYGLDVFDERPQLPSAACPACGRRTNAMGIVIHLNDDHHWSDDQIVAWLEGLGL